MKKLFHTKHAPKIREGEHRFLSDPYFDWVIFIAVSACIAVALIALGAFTYSGMEGRIAAAASVDQAKPVRAVDTALLEKTLGAYDLRAQNTDRIAKGYSGVGDPSL